jgi:hypothetical protein
MKISSNGQTIFTLKQEKKEKFPLKTFYHILKPYNISKSEFLS